MGLARPEEAVTTSEPQTSDGAIFSHRDLLPSPSPIPPHFLLENGEGPDRAGGVGLNKILAQTRGENLIRAVPPDLYRRP